MKILDDICMQLELDFHSDLIELKSNYQIEFKLNSNSFEKNGIQIIA
jgi:hypothetical protein